MLTPVQLHRAACVLQDIAQARFDILGADDAQGADLRDVATYLVDKARRRHDTS